MWLNSAGLSKWSAWTVAHELAHGWEDIYGGKLSAGLMAFTGGSININPRRFARCPGMWAPGCNEAGYYYGGVPPKGSDWNFNPLEDFAESFAARVYPGQAKDWIQRYYSKNLSLQYDDYLTTTRGMYMSSLIYLFAH